GGETGAREMPFAVDDLPPEQDERWIEGDPTSVENARERGRRERPGRGEKADHCENRDAERTTGTGGSRGHGHLQRRSIIANSSARTGAARHARKRRARGQAPPSAVDFPKRRRGSVTRG